jgi:hypothetical protein
VFGGVSVSPVCVSDAMTITRGGVLRAAPWSVPRLAVDKLARSGGDGPLLRETTLPGKLLVDQPTHWRNITPIPHMVLIRITRRYKNIITSNPNAIQFRDRWTWAIDSPAREPITSGLFNGQVGLANDVGTDTVAEPMPGMYWLWWGTTTADEWVGPINPGQKLNMWYRGYVWTPPGWSDNANKNAPRHEAYAGWSRIQMIVFPQGA